MEGTVKERLVQYLKYKKIGQNKFENAAGISNGYISNLKSTPGAHHLTKILNAAPDLNQEWLLTGVGEMLVSEEPVPRKSFVIGKPYYDVDFELGFDVMVNDQTRTPAYLIDFPPYNHCDLWCNATGSSMHTTISSGDIVAMKRINDFSYLINGEIYGIVTSNGLRTIKRVRDNGDTFTLIADNKNVSDQDIPKSIVTHVYHVLGLFKKL